MAHLWSPDTCLDGPCIVEIIDGHKGVVRFMRMCPHHQAVRAKLAEPNDLDALFEAMLETNRAKNYACYEVGKQLGIPTAEVIWELDDKDHVVIKLEKTKGDKSLTEIEKRADVSPGKVIIAEAIAVEAIIDA